MDEVNVPLLRKMVEWVEVEEQLEEGREWNQDYWFSFKIEAPWCGTTMCIAGKVATLEGWELATGHQGALYVERDGVKAVVHEVARTALGLDQPDAFRLFDSANTATDIRTIAEELAGERL